MTRRKALYIDTPLLLLDNNPVMPDRMAMAASLQARSFSRTPNDGVGLLHARHIKLRDRVTKYLFKTAAAPVAGEGLACRKKQVFAARPRAGFETNYGSIAGIVPVLSPASTALRSKRKAGRAAFRLLTNPWHLRGVFDSLGYVEAPRP